MPEVARKRNPVFDLLKFFAIFLVLWGHAIQHLHPSSYADNSMYRFIYSFHMPLFMMIVGYFSGSVMNLTFRELVLKKGRQLIVPSLVVGVVCLVDKWAGNGPGAAFAGYPDYLWFVKSAFFCFVIYFIVVKLSSGMPWPHLWMLLFSIMMALVVYRWNMVWMMPCFLGGVYLRRNFDYFSRHAMWFAIVAGAVWIALFLLWPVVEVCPKRSEVLANGNNLNPFVLFYVGRITTGIAGAFFFIALFQLLFAGMEMKAFGRKVCGWGQETLGIYMVQTVVLEIIIRRLFNLESVSASVVNFIISPVLSAIVLWICLLIIKQLKRSPAASALVLGKPVAKTDIKKSIS